MRRPKWPRGGLGRFACALRSLPDLFRLVPGWSISQHSTNIRMLQCIDGDTASKCLHLHKCETDYKHINIYLRS